MITILVVEDNLLNQEGLCRLLTKRGYRVVVACDGLSALVLEREEHPDLIIMDVSLPDISGYEVTRQIRAMALDHDLPRVPIIALTAHAMQQDRIEAEEAGCSDYETKPIDFKRLFQKIDKHLA